jgi:hypothetical protein
MSKGAPPGVRITQKDLLDATNLDFDEEEEHWNSYTLEDGTTLKVKLVLRGVKRLQRFNPDGTPMYLIQSTNIVRTVNVADALRAKPRPQDRSVNPV